MKQGSGLMKQGRQRTRHAGRRPARIGLLLASLLRVLPSPMRHRARLRERLDQLQSLRHVKELREDAP